MLVEAATRKVRADVIGEAERRTLAKILPADADGVGLTGRRLTNAVNRVVGQVDPEGVRERRRLARVERHVGFSAAEDAMVALWGRMPAEDGRKVDGRLRELLRGGKGTTPTAASTSPVCEARIR